MRRFIFPVIALLGLACAGSGIYFGAVRDEVRIGQALEKFPRPNDTPFFRCADSYYWTSYAREMIETGKLRVRSTAMDNAPDGRRNWGWASLNAWYLVALAKVWSLFAGTSLPEALLPAALWSNPILYALMLAAILIFGLTTNRLPAAAGAIFLFGVSPRVYDDFSYAVPGHHGWHDLACFAALVSLAIAIRKRNSRRWFVAAGLAAAFALWIGATQQAFGLAAAGLGALAGMFVRRENRVEATVDFPAAECWRIFGFSAALAAFLLYLLEYAPGPFAMRLEVNHPLYALAFLLGGEFLCRAQRVLLSPTGWNRNDLGWLVATGAGLTGIVAAVFLGPPEWHAMRQPLMQRLHHEIAEFQPVTQWYGSDWVLVVGAPMLCMAAALWRAWVRGLTMRERAALFVCAAPCLVAIALSFVQLRWAGIAGASAAALAAVLFADFSGRHRTPAASHPGISWAYALCICFSLGLIVCWTARHHGESTGQIRAQVIDRLATMEVAYLLQTDSAVSHPIAVFSNQAERQGWIDYATGIRSLGSLYWDNPAGIRDEARFFADYDEESAHRIARQRHMNFVVIRPNAQSVIAYHYLWQGSESGPQIRETLAYRLAAPHPTPPDWLQLLPTSTPAMLREKIRIYRVL